MGIRLFINRVLSKMYAMKYWKFVKNFWECDAENEDHFAVALLVVFVSKGLLKEWIKYVNFRKVKNMW